MHTHQKALMVGWFGEYPPSYLAALCSAVKSRWGRPHTNSSSSSCLLTIEQTHQWYIAAVNVGQAYGAKRLDWPDHGAVACSFNYQQLRHFKQYCKVQAWVMVACKVYASGMCSV